jgi:lysyl-tRNA synthetase class 2
MPSAVIARWRYFPEVRVLEIVFQTGRVYHYQDVPPTIDEGLRRATSRGEYFNENIRDCFEFERIANI